MKKALFIMAAALMTMTQCRKQETMPVTPSANTIKMTVTAGSGAKTDINTETGAITWSAGDKLYVSDGTNWLGSLTLIGEGGSAQGTFTGSIAGIDETETTCHFFYLGHDNGMEEPTGTAAANISLASQDGTLAGAMKYHAGYGRTDVTVESGEYEGYVLMNTKIAIAHINFTTDGTTAYTGSVTMGGTGISNTLTVSPAGSFSGSGTDGITIGGTTGERFVTLIPTAGTDRVDVAFTGDATGSMTFLAGIHENKFYGMKDAIAVTLEAVTVPVTGVTLNKSSLSLVVGGTATLEAIVEPDDATDPSVTWVSDDEDVATVDDNGVVTAVALGEATITVTTNDGSKTATCEVTVIEPVFSVKAGTTVEFSPGNLYWDGGAFRFEANQWSSASTWDALHVSHFFWSNTTDWQTSGKEPYASSYSYSTRTTSDVFFTNSSSFQVAGETAGTWRTLSKAEWEYLLNTRTNASSLRAWKELDSGEHKGLVILPDGTDASVMESITSTSHLATYGAVFLPAAGQRIGTDVYSAGSAGDYWSGSPHESNDYYAYVWVFNSGNVYVTNINRSFGHSVRLVR